MSDDVSVSDSASSTPVSEPTSVPVETVPTAAETQTAQIPANEPIVPAPEPIPVPPPPTQTSIITPVVNLARDLAAKARAVIQNRKRTKLDKILAEITKKVSVTNDQVEKLLHVSDATATRYLAQLEKEGKIQQVGKTGKSVKYQKL
jgi:ribosomal protein S25